MFSTLKKKVENLFCAYISHSDSVVCLIVGFTKKKRKKSNSLVNVYTDCKFDCLT